jgi:uncharacterized protein
MQKLLVFVLVLVGIYYVRRWFEQTRSATPPRRGAERDVEHVRECRRCGVLVPESEAVKAGEDYYCCPEHARQQESGPR